MIKKKNLRRMEGQVTFFFFLSFDPSSREIFVKPKNIGAFLRFGENIEVFLLKKKNPTNMHTFI